MNEQMLADIVTQLIISPKRCREKSDQQSFRQERGKTSEDTVGESNLKVIK